MSVRQTVFCGIYMDTQSGVVCESVDQDEDIHIYRRNRDSAWGVCGDQE